MKHFFLPFAQALQAAMPQNLPLSLFALFSLLFTLLFFSFTLLFLALFYKSKKRCVVQKQQLEQLAAELQETRLDNVRLGDRLESEQRLFTEKLTLLQEARAELKLQFASLAGDIFDDKSRTFSEQSRDRLHTILSPFHRELGELRKEIGAIYNKDSRERFALKQEIAQLVETSRHLGEEAEGLALALKGDNKIQGNWGEFVLERLLEVSGLRKGVEFTTQSGYRNDDNQLLKPDVVVHLPDKRNVIIDAKTSLLSWRHYLNAEGEENQRQAVKELLSSLRSHFIGLSKKGYPGITELNSVDFVLMFIPIEAAFATACYHQPALMEEALGHNVILTSPTSLLPALRTVQNVWRFEQQEKNAKEIARRATLLYDKFRSFLEEMEKLGRQLDNARGSYDAAINKLSRGRGNLVAQTVKLQELGVQPKQELPQSIVDKADL